MSLHHSHFSSRLQCSGCHQVTGRKLSQFIPEHHTRATTYCHPTFSERLSDLPASHDQSGVEPGPGSRPIQSSPALPESLQGQGQASYRAHSLNKKPILLPTVRAEYLPPAPVLKPTGSSFSSNTHHGPPLPTFKTLILQPQPRLPSSFLLPHHK